MSAPLYLLAAEYREAAAILADSDHDDITVRDTLEGMKGPIEQKIANVLAVAANNRAEARMYRDRKDALAAHEKASTARADRLTDYALNTMRACGLREIRCADFVAKVKANPPSVVIDNESEVPTDCWRVIPEKREIDRAAIKLKLLAGKNTSFAHLEHKHRLEIK